MDKNRMPSKASILLLDSSMVKTSALLRITEKHSKTFSSLSEKKRKKQKIACHMKAPENQRAFLFQNTDSRYLKY